MEAFINELSLHAQFRDVDAVSEAIRRINRVLARLTELPIRPRVLYSTALYYASTTANAIFSGCLNNLPDRSIHLQFRRLLKERLGAFPWTGERCHDECIYEYDERDVSGSSVAEFAERRIRKTEGFLLNFSPSNFGNGTALVQREDGVSALLDLVSSVDELLSWCERFPETLDVRYPADSGRPPLDHETVLRDRGRFSRISSLVQGRNVYREISTGSYWYVDNLHFGAAAHLEVFNAGRSHVGEASLDGVLDRTRADPAKRLTA